MDCAGHHRQRTPARNIYIQFPRTRVHTVNLGDVRLASGASCVYGVVATKRRWVETKISAPHLGTRCGRSQWCNRLPEVVTSSVVGFAFWIEPNITTKKRH